MTKAEYLAWCKQRALKYVEMNDLRNAWESMASDLGKHEETKDHADINLGMRLVMSGNLKTQAEMRDFINGFN